MQYFIVLPHQLYSKKYLIKFSNYHFIIWEHPHYFQKYNYNKKKLVLHRASMKYYYQYLLNNGFKAQYLEYDQTLNVEIKKNGYLLFDPIDRIKLDGKYELIESPNFLLTKDMYSEFRDKTDKFFFHTFYQWGRKKIGILEGVKSQDKDNRKPLPKGIIIPSLPSNKADLDYITDASKYIDKQFSKNYGTTNGFQFPCSHAVAKKWLHKFIKEKLHKFGDYQDAIKQDDSFLFHSVLSTSINIGLINPLEIIEAILKYQAKVKIPINSLEGYIRQLFWREYQRYCYIHYDFSKKNYFNNHLKLNKKWYSGTLNIEPVDDCIKKAFSNGYLNHIERLMIVGNYMNLSRIHPLEGFRWFMEFSCDSYEWVMHQNVLDMVFFVTGGDTMRRPYASSSNYIIKMSNYTRGKWSETWDEKYHTFVKSEKKKLWKFRYFFRGI